MTQRGLTNLVVDFSLCVEKSGGRCVFMGATALPAWGRPRATADADVLLHLPPTRFARFVTELAKVDLRTTGPDLRDAYDEHSHVTVFDRLGPFHVDVRFARTRAEIAEVESGKRIVLPEGAFIVTALEETIAFKLSYGSPQDIEDVRGILAISGEQIDSTRLQPLLEDLGVVEAYRRLIKEGARGRRGRK
ncbi:MAG: hypothetical protein ACLPZM_00635 [Thermoplasmata archaeon]